MSGGVVFAAIAPHGGLAIPEACKPEELELAVATRRAMEELGRRFEATRPDAVVVFTPHNVHVEGSFSVVLAARAAGDLAQWGGPGVKLQSATDLELAAGIRDAIREAGLPALGISYGGNNPAEAVMPMDWAVLIPLWFMGGRTDPPVASVIVSPARDRSPQDHVSAGRAVAAAAAASGKRVALIASSDHGHGHLAAGPYGFRPESADYDAQVVEIVKAGRLELLLRLDPALVAAAAADSWWQMLMLHGALGEEVGSELLSYEAPTYFGMLCAEFRPGFG